MIKLLCGKEMKGFSILTLCFWLVIVSGICIFTCYIPSVCEGADEEYEDSLKDFCNREENQQNPFCLSLFPDGEGGILTSGVNITGNLGVLGAQGGAANITAKQQRKSIEERLEELKKQKKGTGTTDGGESVDTFFGKFGFFVSSFYTDTDRDQTTAETGYDAELKGGMLGIDYRFNDKLVAGIAGGYNAEDADFNGDTGHLDTDSSAITLYGNITPLKSIYINGYMGYTNIDYSSNRVVRIVNANNNVTSIETTSGRTDGRQYTAGFTTGYDWHYGPLTIEPQVKLDYVNTHINKYTENGSDLALRYEDQTIYSLTTNLGFQASYAQSFSWGVLVPHSRLYWVHEYKNRSRGISNAGTTVPVNAGRIDTENPDRNYMVFGGGVSTVMPHGIQLFADYETTFSHEFLHIWKTTVGFRMEF